MRSFGPLSTTLFIGIIAAALTGCGGGLQTGAPTATAFVSTNRGALVRPQSYNTNFKVLAQANQTASGRPYIQIFRASRLARKSLPIATITDALCLPAGLAMDKTGTLYVANGCTDSITEYPAGQTTHSATITAGLQYPGPWSLAMDTKNTLYVTNHDEIIEYPYGSLYPAQTITSSDFNLIDGVTVDKGGNIFVADTGAHTVWEIPYGTTYPQNMNLQGLHSPDDVAVDPSGNLWVTDNGTNYISGFANVYPPGSLYPSHTISNLGYPYFITIDKRGTVAISNIGGYIYVYKPGQFTPSATVTNGVSYPSGVVLAKP